jgi:hypothetical protein
LSAAETQSYGDQTTAASFGSAASLQAELPSEPRNRLHDYMDGMLASEITLEDPLFCNLMAQPATDLQFIDEASFADVDFGLSWYNTET